MRLPAAIVTATFMTHAAGGALACESIDEAMAQFEEVKNAYIAAAQTLKPEQFEIWATHIQSFGDAMGQMNYAGACNALNAASIELNLDVALTPAVPEKAAESAPAASAPTTAAPESAHAADAADVVWKECPRGRCRN